MYKNFSVSILLYLALFFLLIFMTVILNLKIIKLMFLFCLIMYDNNFRYCTIAAISRLKVFSILSFFSFQIVEMIFLEYRNYIFGPFGVDLGRLLMNVHVVDSYLSIICIYTYTHTDTVT